MPSVGTGLWPHAHAAVAAAAGPCRCGIVGQRAGKLLQRAAQPAQAARQPSLACYAAQAIRAACSFGCAARLRAGSCCAAQRRCRRRRGRQRCRVLCSARQWEQAGSAESAATQIPGLAGSATLPTARILQGRPDRVAASPSTAEAVRDTPGDVSRRAADTEAQCTAASYAPDPCSVSSEPLSAARGQGWGA